MKEVKFYWLPHCSTCKKAAGWLERRGVEITEFRDIKEDPLSREEVEGLIKMLGGDAEDLFSKRAVKYREMKLNERELSREEMIELMTDEYTFLKRPMLVIDGHAVAGFFERPYIAFLDEHYFPRTKKAGE